MIRCHIEVDKRTRGWGRTLRKACLFLPELMASPKGLTLTLTKDSSDTGSKDQALVKKFQFMKNYILIRLSCVARVGGRGRGQGWI